MAARYRYRIRVRERLEVREGDETELVTWPEGVAYYHDKSGVAGVACYFTVTDGAELVRDISSWEQRYGGLGA